MTQLRIWDFGAPRKSEYLNVHFQGIVPTKIKYRGYWVNETTTPSLNLNITRNGHPSSILMTEEGVRIEENLDLNNAVTIVPHSTLDRIDWVLASHQYTNLNNPQTYEILEGTAGAPPTEPPSVPQYKVLLAKVYVPANATAITQDLIDNLQEINLDNNIGRDSILELRPDPKGPPSNKILINAGTYVKSDGLLSIDIPDTDTPVFAPVSSAGLERYDLVTLDDTGAIGITSGVEAATSTAIVPDYPGGKQVVAEIYIDEDVDVRVTKSNIRDVRFFFNLGGLSAINASLVTTDTTNFNNILSAADNTVQKALDTLDDHVHGGGGNGLAILPKEIINFIPDDIAPITNVTLWQLQSAIRFSSLQNESVFFSFDKPDIFPVTTDIQWKCKYSITTNASAGDLVRLLIDWWIINDGSIPNIASPTISSFIDLNVGTDIGNTLYLSNLSGWVIANVSIPTSSCQISGRITRDIAGAAQNYADAFDLISLVPYIV